MHVVAFPQRLPVEVQVRTELQHEWAEAFEKLADRIGRGIRYGAPPVKRILVTPGDEDVTDEVLAAVESFAQSIDTIERLLARAPDDQELAESRTAPARSLRTVQAMFAPAD